jgi:hypothetical protein
VVTQVSARFTCWLATPWHILPQISD